MKIKVLVTGANGQLGKTIEELFKVNSDDIDFTFLSKLELDITNKEDLNDLFSKQSFNYCINCAAYTNVEQAEKTPEIAYQINAEGVKNLAEVCKNHRTILLHISTDYVFDGKKGVYHVHDKPNPINEYGTSKLLGEEYINEVNPNYFIIRTSWLYSKKFGKNFYRTILQKAQTEQTLYITDAQTGCPTHTESLAQYIFKIIKTESTNFGIHHFCDKEIMTWYSFAESILKENKLLSKINLVKANNYITFATRPKSTILL